MTDNPFKPEKPKGVAAPSRQPKRPRVRRSAWVQGAPAPGPGGKSLTPQQLARWNRRPPTVV